MVDPISLISAICAVISTTKSLHEWWHMYQQRKLVGKTKQHAKTERKLLDAFMSIWKKYNRIASFLGMRFSLRFNKSLMRDLNGLRPKLLSLQQGLRELEKSHTMRDGDVPTGTEDAALEKILILAQITQDVEEETERALTRLYPDEFPSEKDLLTLEDQRLVPTNVPRRFCEGAMLFQIGDKDDQYLNDLAESCPSKSGWGYICNACGLEVGHYPAVRLSHDGRALDSSILLTASHLLAFKSIHDRRAYYRCLPCYKQRKIVEFPSALAFEQHMEHHPGFTLLREHEENERALFMSEKELEFMSGTISDAEDEQVEGSVPGLNSHGYDHRKVDKADYKGPLGGLEKVGKSQNGNRKEDEQEVSDVEDDFEHQPSIVSAQTTQNGTDFQEVSPLPSKVELDKSSQSLLLPDWNKTTKKIAGSFPHSSGHVAPTVARPVVESGATSIFEAESTEIRSEKAPEVPVKTDISSGSQQEPPAVKVPAKTFTELAAETPTKPVELAATSPLPNLEIKPRASIISNTVTSRPRSAQEFPASPIESSGPSAAVPNPNQAPYPVTPTPAAAPIATRKPEFWIMESGVFKGIVSKRVVIEQDAMPLDEWIRPTQAIEKSMGKKWMMKQASNGEIIYA